MAYLVAIERDTKSHKEIQTSWSDIAKEMGHEVLIFSSLAEFKADFDKPENAERVILLMLICLEEMKTDLVNTIDILKAKYKCSILLTIYEDPLKPFKNPEALPVRNVIYRPFDLTILKEHTRFAILNGQETKTQFVHTTQAETEIETLKKFQIAQISEFGFKVDKRNPLEKNKSYKFYHPLFANQRNQHAWARVVNEDDAHYELVLCQANATLLSQIRKKVASSQMKVRKPVWTGMADNTTKEPVVALQLSDDALATSLFELLGRNFKDCKFLFKGDINPKVKTDVDLLITDVNYDEKILAAQFNKKPVIIRLHEDTLKRSDLEKRFETEFVRFEKTIDKSLLVKAIKMAFPQLQESEEIIKSTVQMDEMSSLSEIIKIKDFSEAAISYADRTRRKLDETVDFALPQEDESQLREMKARVHFVDEKPNADGEYLHQMVLFGMKDEYLKLFRLWALQKHIEKNKGN